MLPRGVPCHLYRPFFWTIGRSYGTLAETGPEGVTFLGTDVRTRCLTDHHPREREQR